MNFLSQNWWWILLLIGVFLFLGRRRGHGGLGGFGHGHHGHGGGSSDHRDHSQRPADPTIATDPVTHKDVPTTQAVTSVYQGRIYYFESPENRQRFEASPEQYARQGLSYPHDSEERSVDRPRRRRGGC